MKPLCLVLPEVNQGPEDCQEPYQPRKWEVPSSIKASNRNQPTTSFYLSVDGACLFISKFSQDFTGAPAAAGESENKQEFPSGACLLNRYLRSSTGSQVYNVLLLQPVGFLGIKSLSGQCTQLDIPWSLTAVGEWLKLLYTCPSILVTIGLWRILFPGFKKNLIPGLYLGRNFSFLCSSSGTQQWTCPRLIIYLRAWFMSSPSRMAVVRQGLRPLLGVTWTLRSAIGSKLVQGSSFLAEVC